MTEVRTLILWQVGGVCILAARSRIILLPLDESRGECGVKKCRSGGVSEYLCYVNSDLPVRGNTFSILLTLLAVTMVQKCPELIDVFPWQQWLYECDTMLCSMYISDLVFFFRIMACFTSLLVREAEMPLKTSPFMSIASIARGIVTNDVSPTFYNRNPRNLERLRIAYKPSGYHLEAPGREFWHKYVYRKYIGCSESSHTVHSTHL